MITLVVERTRFTLAADGSSLFADASDLGLYGWPESVTVRYGTEENIFTRVGYEKDGEGAIQAARYGNRIGQVLVIFND